MNRQCREKGIDEILVHTGQHYDDNLSQVFFDELGIPRPDINLGIGSGTREEQIERIKEAFEPVVAREKPDLVLSLECGALAPLFTHFLFYASR